MTSATCTFEYDTIKSIQRNKKAIEAGLFIIFLAYTFIVVLAERKKGSGVASNLKRFINEMAYQQIFFFLIIIATHYIIPHKFPAFLFYIYFLSFFGQIFAYIMQKKLVHLIMSALQFVIVFILFIMVMANKWCSYFLYRGY